MGEDKTMFEILEAVGKHTATKEDIEYYKENCMTDCERAIGKPIFEMNDEEITRFHILSYNSSIGTLKGYDCPKCQNRGDFLDLDEHGNFISVPCSCWAIRDTEKRMRKSGLGDLFETCTFDKYICKTSWQKDAYARARAFVDSDDSWFVMLGSSGCGKTMLCTAIAGELIKKGMGLRYMMWVDESTRMKQDISNDPENYARLMEEFKDTQVLYIDDLFKGDNATPPSPADIKLAFDILNYRYNKARTDKEKRWVTIISSERTIEQLLTYDEAIGGRIAEMTAPLNLVIINGENKNYRMKWRQ